MHRAICNVHFMKQDHSVNASTYVNDDQLLGTTRSQQLYHGDIIGFGVTATVAQTETKDDKARSYAAYKVHQTKQDHHFIQTYLKTIFINPIIQF